MSKLKKTFEEYVFNSERVRRNIIKEEYKMKKSYVLTTGLIAVIVLVLGYIGLQKLNNKGFENKTPNTEPVSFLTISINPEIELGLDSEDKVVEVVPINSDADVLTSDLDLEGLTVEEASEKIVDSAIDTGHLDEYSDENTIVVTTINDNEETREALQQRIMDKLNAHFETRKIYPILVAKGLDDDLRAEADTYGISYGKMLLVEKAITLDNTLSKDELVKMSIKDIQIKIRTYVTARRNALKLSVQEAKAKWQEQKTQLKQDYRNKIEELKTTITEEHKEEFKNMTPAQKKEAIKNYLNTIKENIKNDMSAIREDIKTDVKEDMKNYNYPILENNVNTIKENIKNRIEQRRNNR